jgi:hypothetical protein
MASTKQELIEEATKLGLKVEKSATIANLKALIAEQDKTAEETETTEVTETEDVAIGEAEETTAKEERKADKAQDAEKPKVIQKKSRSKLERQGKGIRNSAKKIELGKAYGLEEAIDLAKSTSHVKFDATVELHVNLNVDPRHADQNIRDNLVKKYE